MIAGPGWIATARGRKLCEKLKGIEIADVEFQIRPVKEYRFLLVARGEGLNASVTDPDPHRTGVKSMGAELYPKDGSRTAGRINRFVKEAQQSAE